MLSLSDAVERSHAVFACLGSERVGLLEATGRRLAEAIVARRALPPFHASAMDGYAIRSADLRDADATRPITLAVVGEIAAGVVVDRSVGPGEAMRIFTGAPMPPGADAVIVQEDTTREGERVHCRFAPKPGLHVRAAGSDVGAGAPLLDPGARVEAGEIALLASQDVASLRVVRRPVVAIVSTGDELREVGEPDRPGSIVNGNALMLASLVAREGGVPRVLPIAPDDPRAITALLREALFADLVITTGGVSVGDHDHVPAALAELGVETVVQKVRMKPGKPVVIGLRGRVPVVGLPGNPASALVGFELFVVPGLRAMQGERLPFAAGEEIPLAEGLRRSTGRPELARGAVRWIDGHRRLVLPTTQGSGALRSLVGVDALALLGADVGALEAGAPVFTLPLGGVGRLTRSPLADRIEARG